MLVDADNVAPSRLQPVLDLLSNLFDPDGAETPPGSNNSMRAELQLTASGRQAALDRLRWPAGSELLTHSGWQRADLALAGAYSPDERPLVLVTGDGDFALLATRHPGPVLVVSGAASGRLRDVGLVVDPATDGVAPIAAWVAEHSDPDR